MLPSFLNRVCGKIVPHLPAKWRLHAATRLWQLNNHHQAELIRIREYLPQDKRRIALDIGANAGMTSVFLSRIFQQVIAFEPNATLVNRWQSVAPSNVQLHCVALSDSTATRSLHVPVVNGSSYHGWATFGTAKIDVPHQVKDFSVECRSLDDWNLGPEIDFIKIDVEGHEREVLKGSQKTLTRSRPWLVVETSPETSPDVNQLLATLGYQRFDLASALGLPGPTPDEVFRPAEAQP